MSELDATDTNTPTLPPTPPQDTPQTPPPPPSLPDTLRQTLATASTPLTLKELAKGLKRPSKVRAPEFEASLPGYLADDLQSGRVFKYGSGKAGADRYWSRDERHALREAVLSAAATPATVADLVKKAVAVGLKTDKAFAESVVRDLIGEDRLFEHPPKKKGGQPLFGAEKAPPPPPPPHPLEVGKVKKDFDKLVASAKKLLDAIEQVSADELLTRLGTRLREGVQLTPGAAETLGASPRTDAVPAPHDPAAIEKRVLDIVGGVPTMLLSELRSRLPADDQGPAFDAAVIRLAEAEKVVIDADADPQRFSDDERSRFVRDQHGRVYTTISKRS
jgi:hypothetical protein